MDCLRSASTSLFSPIRIGPVILPNGIAGIIPLWNMLDQVFNRMRDSETSVSRETPDLIFSIRTPSSEVFGGIDLREIFNDVVHSGTHEDEDTLRLRFYARFLSRVIFSSEEQEEEPSASE